MRRLLNGGLAALVILLRAGTAVAEAPHPLCPAASSDTGICAIADPASRLTAGAPATAPASLDAIARRAAAVDLVLLGEVHDNPHHHRLRAALIRAIVTERRKSHPQMAPAAVFEQIREDQRALIESPGAAGDGAGRPRTASDLLSALDWERSGWPSGEIYAPLFSAALDLGLPILPGDPPREAIRRIAREGVAALEAGERSALSLDAQLPDALGAALLDELEASHCGLMPRSAFGTMAMAQRYRDAHLARALAMAADRHGAAILIAGNGHVRKDRGVPWALARLAPGRTILVVAFSEASADRPGAADYVEAGADGRTLADLVVVTPRTERPDPCVEMRARFGRKG